MKLLHFDMYLDGGTKEFQTDKGIIMIDYNPPYNMIGGRHGIPHKDQLLELRQAILDIIPSEDFLYFETEENKTGMIDYFKTCTTIFND